MTSLPEDVRRLLWKLSEARERAVDLKLHSTAQLIRLAMDDLADTGKLPVEVANGSSMTA